MRGRVGRETLLFFRGQYRYIAAADSVVPREEIDEYRKRRWTSCLVCLFVCLFVCAFAV